jgi:hypothetical protein
MASTLDRPPPGVVCTEAGPWIGRAADLAAAKIGREIDPARAALG